ncbi:hypothetical protein G4Y73_08810 [Wenzhouxiangella sp. XN201]|uniref:hypothetical protein n=1 Tax=Wenzhouxiangella sp. XN201 TaxID=2710755 RepID=UPI0013C98D59|nr:hypothetical protein [Wenzhouxiangella sp. XN201]NEZ04243.1 hypothetical protein [Wenzhouxiangella sp. XN201]
MHFLLPLTALLAALVTSAPASGADITRIELQQREDVVLQHQRFVGNTRAQAKRSGVITRVPQLYVYFTDYSTAWHLHSFRRGFERELALTYDHQRRERTMVGLDQLLERTLTPQGEEFTLEDLPQADIYLLVYERAGCEDCERIKETLADWLAGRPELKAVWIDVWLGLRTEP